MNFKLFQCLHKNKAEINMLPIKTYNRMLKQNNKTAFKLFKLLLIELNWTKEII